MIRHLFTMITITCALNCMGNTPLAQETAYPPGVQNSLEKADSNRVELEEALSYYQALDDTLKLQAAYFLIANMEGHAYATYALYDSAKNEIPFDAADYADYDTLLAAWDTLEAVYPGLDFGKKEVIYDLKTITADFLIGQIDQAFQAWREKPWVSWMTYEQFREYVLPYRGSNEPLEDWRGTFLEKYKDLPAAMKNPADPIEAARLINDDIITWFKFDRRYYYHPTDQGLSEMLSGHFGRCEDMTNLAIYAMRANALAVTSDYTPYWANSGNNHAWNAILAPDGKVVPFMGAEANPGEYSLWNKLAKVYRKMYSQRKDNLVFLDRKQKKIPGWLGGKSYIDVTSDYVDAVDITVRLEEPALDSVDIAYICVFNSGAWQPIHWGRIEGDLVTFTAMGTDIAYLPAYFVSEDSIIPAGPPFILTPSGEIQSLRQQPKSSSTTFHLVSTTARAEAPSTDGVEVSFLTAGADYELYHWEDGWKSIWKGKAANGPLNIIDPPMSGLFWLVADGSNRDERIFTMENGKQVWW